MMFSLLSVLSLTIVGLQSLADAGDRMTQARIVQSVSAHSILMPFTRLNNFVVAGPYFFTDEAEMQSAQDETSRYRVDLIKADGEFPGSANATNEGNEADFSASVMVIRIEISRTVGKPGKQCYVIHVPNSGT